MNSRLGVAGIMLLRYDPDAGAIFDAMPSPPPFEYRRRVNWLVKAAKNKGYWSRMDALFVSKRALDAQMAVLDWRRLVSGSISGSASWSHEDGFIGSTVAGSHIDSAFVPSVDGVNYQLNTCSFGCYITGVATAGSYFGRQGGTPNQAVYLSGGGSGLLGGKINSHAGGVTASIIESTGLFVLARSASNSWRIDKNGSTVYSDTDASGGVSPSPIYLCAQRNEIDDYVFVESDSKIGAWWAGDDFAAEESLEIKSLFDAYYSM